MLVPIKAMPVNPARATLQADIESSTMIPMYLLFPTTKGVGGVPYLYHFGVGSEETTKLRPTAPTTLPSYSTRKTNLFFLTSYISLASVSAMPNLSINSLALLLPKIVTNSFGMTNSFKISGLLEGFINLSKSSARSSESVIPFASQLAWKQFHINRPFSCRTDRVFLCRQNTQSPR